MRRVSFFFLLGEGRDVFFLFFFIFFKDLYIYYWKKINFALRNVRGVGQHLIRIYYAKRNLYSDMRFGS